MRRPVTWLDVFTSTPLTGNQLAVVHDADDLDEATMLAYARETRLSETTFVQRATKPGADYFNRIFTMSGEIRFAGHPSLGTAVAVARARGEDHVTYVQQTHAGQQPVEVRLDGDGARASMLQEPPRFGPEPSRSNVMSAAGLGERDAHPDLPPQVVWTGMANLIAPLRDRAALELVAPTVTALRNLLVPLDALVLYLVAVDPHEGTAHARGFFLGLDAIMEDPATGSAAGPLLAYLRERAGTRSLKVRQGDEMARPSSIDCSWADDRPRVAGNVVVVGGGHLSI
ncbi:MAG: PhzF family phenazine biosynthesis protein [Solirubrobacteraceae bacterium]